uniref:Putative ovule protein n=1 Tax=Solanum chacoense TaxID=4108 RepID=A0A0V0HM42_SOLCH
MKCSLLHNSKLKCSNYIHLPRPHVPCIYKRFVQTIAAFLQCFVTPFTTEFPENHVVSWISCNVPVACEIDYL